MNPGSGASSINNDPEFCRHGIGRNLTGKECIRDENSEGDQNRSENPTVGLGTILGITRKETGARVGATVKLNRIHVFRFGMETSTGIQSSHENLREGWKREDHEMDGFEWGKLRREWGRRGRQSWKDSPSLSSSCLSALLPVLLRVEAVAQIKWLMSRLLIRLFVFPARLASRFLFFFFFSDPLFVLTKLERTK